MTDQIPLYDVNKVITGDEVVDDIRSVIDSGWLTLGQQTETFESKFASAHGAEHGIAVNSCTSALYAALRALGVGDGDRVVVPAMTFSATANVVRLLGGDVVLCDVKDNGNMDPVALKSVLDERDDVTTVIPVHLYGLPCDMYEILSIADEHDVDVVEDCAHAPGATLDGQPVGSFGDVGCFSFYATKNMTTGEGGMAITSDDELAAKIFKLRNHHQTKTPEEKEENWGYDVDGLGFNFRMSEISAAMGVNQLQKLPAMNESRREVAEEYIEAIEDIDGLTWRGGDDRKEHVFHLFVVQIQDEYHLTRNELYDHLANQNILSGVHYPPISRLGYYEGVAGDVSNAEALFERILSIPMFPDMAADTQNEIIEALRP
ncbi:DegT/DnrJ/EryC1/StrS family aminotransferase [Haloarchaeobius sp. TZWWS8]|uniref:DegT/DnrJ/EryC1/StrS family aminotransferase n=1 Tax=Haloarchaeobius sp. TZWWS8 TaxID=3446121 RepID=UPI003EBA8585